MPPILVNEMLSHTDLPTLDAIELYNPTTQDVDVGGWYISDDFNTPKKFRIPEETIIPANDYLVFDERWFNFPTNAPNSFSFSSRGDEAYLFSGDAGGNLTGYFHGFAFGAADTGVSFGRYVNSAGAEQFVALIQVRTAVQKLCSKAYSGCLRAKHVRSERHIRL